MNNPAIILDEIQSFTNTSTIPLNTQLTNLETKVTSLSTQITNLNTQVTALQNTSTVIKQITYRNVYSLTITDMAPITLTSPPSEQVFQSTKDTIWVLIPLGTNSKKMSITSTLFYNETGSSYGSLLILNQGIAGFSFSNVAYHYLVFSCKPGGYSKGNVYGNVEIIEYK